MNTFTTPRGVPRVHVRGGATALLALAALAGLPAQAAEAAQTGWLLRAGVHQIDPKSDNGSVAGVALDVDERLGFTFNLDYFFTPHLALDLLGGAPFKHGIALAGAKAGSVKHLPPTLTLQYHLLPEAAFDPYVGAGLNYTVFFDEQLDGGGRLQLDDSFGLAAQAGVDFKLGGPWLVGIDVRYIDIDSDVKLDGAKIGTAKIDPLAYGLTIGYRF